MAHAGDCLSDRAVYGWGGGVLTGLDNFSSIIYNIAIFQMKERSNSSAYDGGVKPDPFGLQRSSMTICEVL